MEVEIISRECIKPSSATPLHLKTYKLCLLDQFRGHVFAPRFFYYDCNSGAAANNDNNNIDQIISERLQLLKHSLSDTLAHFYPLAGRMTEDYSIDCNDEGIYIVEARAKSSLSEFLNEPDISLINKFFPAEVIDGSEQSGRQLAGAYVAKVQVTSFACGGLVVCACISHLLGDGATFNLFMKTWAAISAASASKKEEAISSHSPSYDASAIFPHYEAYPRDLNRNSQLARFRKTGRVVTRRLVFGAKAIADLKAKASSSSVQNPTRVEAVSALLSKCIRRATAASTSSTDQSASRDRKSTLVTHAVNLRRKARPPLPDHLVGNIIYHANALCGDEDELDGLVCQLREAIAKLDADFVKSLQGAEGFSNLLKAVKDEEKLYSDVENTITFTSSCSFRFYDIDFGWGKPVWVSVSGFGGSIISLSTSLVILMSTRPGDGVEAWVSLLEEYMHLLETDQQLLAFATFDPSPRPEL